MTGALAALLAASTALGSSIERVAEDVALPSDAAARLRRGEMLQYEPAGAAERELAVGLTFLVQQPPVQVMKAFRAATDLKADDQLASDTPLRGQGMPADFASLVLEPSGAAEADRYLAVRAGDTLNLSADEIAAFRSLAPTGKATQGQVEDEVRRVLLARYRAYRQRGLAGILPYERPSGPFDPSAELQRASTESRLFEQHAPAMQRLLLSYPSDPAAGLEEHFYWLRYALDGRPNFTLRHRLAMPVGESWAIADREFYVSHGYNTSQALAGLIPVPEGTLIVYASRVSTDQIAGFGSSVKKKIGRTVMAKQLTDVFERSRASFR
jgi:hypothetical protein